MSNLIDVFTNFIVSLANFEWFWYFAVSLAVFGVILLIRKIIYA